MIKEFVLYLLLSFIMLYYGSKHKYVFLNFIVGKDGCMYFKRKRKSFLRNIVERQKLQKNVKSNFKEFKDYSIINRFGISCYMNQDENLVAILNNGKLFDIFPVDDCSKVKIVVRRTYGRSLYLQINSHVYMKDSPTSKLMELEFMSDVNIECKSQYKIDKKIQN